MRPGDTHPTDAVVEQLTGLFDEATTRLGSIVHDGLRRGLDPGRAHTPDAKVGDATQKYRDRQLRQANLIFAQLRLHTDNVAPVVASLSYRAGALAVDAVVDPGTLAGTFGGPNVRAATAIARNLTDRLQGAVATAEANTKDVFDRAALLAQHPDLIGRLHPDEFRTASLKEIGKAMIAGDARRDVSAALTDRLIREGVTDALTGFVDKSGRRWPLDVYSKMVARTTTREAVSVATQTRLLEGGHDLVEISSHEHDADECSPYDGETFSLNGDTPGYEILDELPPFHPNAVVAGTIVQSEGIVAASRAVYDGPLVDLTTTGGVVLTVSPHHPVLTARGWLPANLVRERDQVLRGSHGQRAGATSAGEHLYHPPAPVEEVFDSWHTAGLSSRVAASTAHFHGDGQYVEGDIDVVSTDSELLRDLDTVLSEHRREQALVGAGARLPLLPSTSAGLDRRRRVRAAIARSWAKFDAAASEAPAEGRAADWQIERERLDALAAVVSVDEVVEVRYRERVRTHVYDLQSVSGTYFANSIRTHNCLHVMTPAGADLDKWAAELEGQL